MIKAQKKPRQILKHIIDAAITILLLFLMGYQFWEDFFHEWAGRRRRAAGKDSQMAEKT